MNLRRQQLNTVCVFTIKQITQWGVTGSTWSVAHHMCLQAFNQNKTIINRRLRTVYTYISAFLVGKEWLCIVAVGQLVSSDPFIFVSPSLCGNGKNPFCYSKVNLTIEKIPCIYAEHWSALRTHTLMIEILRWKLNASTKNDWNIEMETERKHKKCKQN